MPVSVYENVKKALQDIVAPELHALQVEIKRLDEKMDSGFKHQDEKMDSGFKHQDEKIGSGFKHQDEKMDSFRHELLSEIHRIDERLEGFDKRIDTAIDLHERIATIEAKLAIH